jgi:hypothetical protein
VVETDAASIADGRAMASLTADRRKFVHALIQLGPNKHAARMAATAAGYTNPVYGYELMREEGIIAALREEATKKLAGAALLGVQVMMDIAQDPMHKDQYRAAKDLAAINGFTAEQKIVVEHLDRDGRQLIGQIREMAGQLGMDPRQLIAAAGIIEAEFTEAPLATEECVAEVDDSDW